MPTNHPKVDAYIARSAPFAKPVLEHLRALAHAAIPNVEEGIKWGMPFFLSDGTPVCHMAAFKAHCAFGLWRANERGVGDGRARDAMGQLGRVTSLKDLPPDKVLRGWIAETLEHNASDAKTVRPNKPVKAFTVPDALAKALRANKVAKQRFGALPPGAQREYADWIAEAKTDATREKRLATALAWIAEGKRRNWKYEAKK